MTSNPLPLVTFKSHYFEISRKMTMAELLTEIQLTMDLRLDEWMNHDGITYGGTGQIEKIKWNKETGDLEEITIDERIFT